MIRLGRYRIAFGNTFWLQSNSPIKVRYFLRFWLLKESRSTDIDKKKEFPLGTQLEENGRRYYYYRAGEDIKVEEAVRTGGSNERHQTT